MDSNTTQPLTTSPYVGPAAPILINVTAATSRSESGSASAPAFRTARVRAVFLPQVPCNIPPVATYYIQDSTQPVTTLPDGRRCVPVKPKVFFRSLGALTPDEYLRHNNPTAMIFENQQREAMPGRQMAPVPPTVPGSATPSQMNVPALIPMSLVRGMSSTMPVDVSVQSTSADSEAGPSALVSASAREDVRSPEPVMPATDEMTYVCAASQAEIDEAIAPTESQSVDISQIYSELGLQDEPGLSEALEKIGTLQGQAVVYEDCIKNKKALMKKCQEIKQQQNNTIELLTNFDITPIETTSIPDESPATAKTTVYSQCSRQLSEGESQQYKAIYDTLKLLGSERSHEHAVERIRQLKVKACIESAISVSKQIQDIQKEKNQLENELQQLERQLEEALEPQEPSAKKMRYGLRSAKQ